MAGLLLVVPGAEVEPELDLGRDEPPDPQQPLEHARAHVGERRRHVALEHPELEVRVPLDRELVVRDLGRDPRELAPHRPLVGGLDRRLIVDATKALTGASGVGSETWKRQPRGTTPSRFSTANVRYEATAASAYPSESNSSADASSPGRRRSRGNARYDRGVGGATSNCGRELSTGYCQTIQSARGPVSPSGIRRTRVPSSPATRRNTASALASGTLPTRCAPRGTKPAPVDVG